MSKLIEDFDHALTAVRDTDSHIVSYGEDGSDGEDTGVLYDYVECAVMEVAEKWQADFDKQAEQIKLLRDRLLQMTDSYVEVCNCYDDEVGNERGAHLEDSVIESLKALAATEPK